MSIEIKQIETRICDECNNKVITDGETSVDIIFSGWTHVIKTRKLSHTHGGQTEFDFCSYRCLRNFADCHTI